MTGQEWWLAALLVGYVVVVPLTELLYGDTDEEAADADEVEPALQAMLTTKHRWNDCAAGTPTGN